jgi:Domain of unknown function (DUF5615)
MESTHVSWIGMSGAKDHVVTSRAIIDGFVLVTHNTVEFRPLYARQEVHVGLIGFNTAAGIMSLELQKRLFLLTLRELAGSEAWNEVLEIFVSAQGLVTVERYDLPK